MNSPGRMVSLVATVTLALAVALLESAAGAPAPWTEVDIGRPSHSGSTRVDADGPWTITGGGAGVWHHDDQFHYVYQLVSGDASISARFLSMEGGNDEWSRAGLLIREDDTAGSPNLYYHMTPGHGLCATMRAKRDGNLDIQREVGDRGTWKSGEQGPIFLRLQRAGSEITGFYSWDGKVWFQAAIPTRLELPFGGDALFGLAVTAQDDDLFTTARLDGVDLRRADLDPKAMSVYGLIGCGGNRQVLLQWRPPEGAVGVNVYRGPKGAQRRDQLVPLNTDLVRGTSYPDRRPDLGNGTTQTYAVAAVFTDSYGSPVEGPLVAVQVTPVPVPQEWMGCSINEIRESGSVTYDGSTITLKGSGGGFGIRDKDVRDPVYTDEFHYLCQEVEGDARISVQVQEPLDIWAGLMLRESLDAGARFVALGHTGEPGNKISWRFREATNGFVAPGQGVSGGSLHRVAVVLQIVRRGDTVSLEYSKDDGRNFRPLGSDFTLPTLPKRLYVGLAISALDRQQTKTGTFSGLLVKPLR